MAKYGKPTGGIVERAQGPLDIAVGRRYPPAIVLGVSPAGLAVARSLGRRGVEVWGVDGNTHRAAFASRFCKRFAILKADSSEHELLDKLLKFGAQAAEKPVIFATDDDYLLFLADHSPELLPYFRFSQPDPSLLEAFINKRFFYELCTRYNIPAPPTYIIDDCRALVRIAQKIHYPAIIKPVYTHLWAKKYGLRKAFLAHDATELSQAYELLGDMKSNVIIQQAIGGRDDQIIIFAGYFNQKTEPLRIFTGRKIRQYPPGFGNTTVAESVWEPTAAELSLRLLQALDFQGLCDVEFKRDPVDGQLKIIEINPRAGTWYGLTDAAGVDVTYTAYLDLIGEAPSPKPPCQRYVKWVFLSRDVLSAGKQLLTGNLTFSDYIASIRGPRAHAVFSWQDPLPTAAYVIEILSYLLRKP